MKIRAITLAMLCGVAFGAQANDCREAEEAIAEMSVNVADAYQSADFDKAKPLLAKANANSKKGGEEAKACGCNKVGEPLGKADELLKDALDIGGGFSDVQDRLYAVIGQSEKARRAAEICWREKATAAAQKK